MEEKFLNYFFILSECCNGSTGERLRFKMCSAIVSVRNRKSRGGIYDIFD